MQIRFLLGPAGSGKTFRCLSEIREVLHASAEGPPLILLAPKQATFQLERQLLADESLPGYTRLHILSFERLARFVFGRLQMAPPEMLNEEGRLMVLRGLLAKRRDDLKLFRASARLTGFAQQLNLVLRELQRHQLTPDSLLKVAGEVHEIPGLSLKLHDLATLLREYLSWLKAHNLQDADCLLDAAAEAIQPPGSSSLRIDCLWLDGFAELAPQELNLLAAIVPHCQGATLAFCLDHVPNEPVSWLSHWSIVRRTFEECRNRLARAPGITLSFKRLGSNHPGRFQGSPALQHLEANWGKHPPSLGATPSAANSEIVARYEKDSVRIVACLSPEAEARFAAREILQFVRRGGRFREVAVLVRELHHYHDPLQRAFSRYEIPFFLDRREQVAHHPLSELTRSALRTVAFQWTHDDWFAALKTGFVPATETEIDWLENESLARGWRGASWSSILQIPDQAALSDRLERIHKRIVPPFQTLGLQIAAEQNRPTGPQLVAALRKFWENLNVEERLQAWTDALEADQQQAIGVRQPAIHLSVWQQMNSLLDNLALAFSEEALPLREWLPILEAGLANLTVGLIPPALDQVLIGAIDRSRNPDLKFALVLGLNETIFPARPDQPFLLTDEERDELSKHGARLGPGLRDQAARERYYGYIAFTRAREKLALTFSQQDEDGNPLIPSMFIQNVGRIFP